MALKIQILFDNTTINENMTPLWGFSALITIDKIKILFDTGSNGRILLKNATKMNISFQDLHYLFISHPHWDHIGGIDSVLEENHNLTGILPVSLSSHYIEDLKKFMKNTIVVGHKPVEIIPSVFSTGIMSEIGEQSLILRTEQGLVIITGCGHPGIENIIYKAQKIYEKNIFFIIGGFHLLHSSEEEINLLASKIKTKFICPTHCTGDFAIDTFAKYFTEGFIRGGAGKEIFFDTRLE